MTDVMDRLPTRNVKLPTRSVKRYGWKRSLPMLGEAHADTSELTVLPEVDPRGEMPAVFDQGQLGSCTANATAGAFQYDGILDGADPGELSRLFIYYGERCIEGVLGQGDTGAFGHDAFTVASTIGVPPESAWPYEIGTFEGPVPDEAVKDEAHYKLAKPAKAVPQDQQSIMAILSNKQTVAFGFTVYESFESAEVAQKGIVPMPAQGESVLGGHEVLIVGYLKDEPLYALVRNSWGTGWGIGGYCLMPWAMILSSSISADHRTIQRPAAK